ncbi:MAG TPA: hypothetical protein VG937_30415 [Polyangiaceae bacterium]|nr:hypothetical protein [Polyangiaceae bacterium]
MPRAINSIGGTSVRATPVCRLGSSFCWRARVATPTPAAALWYRGIQTSGADGRITFDTNFPGWYASRATHIHFKVSVGSIQTLTSQVFFDDALKSEIYDSQPNYQQ